MNLTNEEVRGLAEMERLMDRGEVPFVMWNGQRLPMAREIMDELGLEQGQSISVPIFVAIQRAHIASCQAQIALQKVQAD